MIVSSAAAILSLWGFLGMASSYLLPQHKCNPAKTILITVRAWEQQCEVLQTYQGMAKTCHFQVRLEVKPETAMGRRHSCLSLGFSESAQAVLIVLMSHNKLNEDILLYFNCLGTSKGNFLVESSGNWPSQSSKYNCSKDMLNVGASEHGERSRTDKCTLSGVYLSFLSIY